MICHPRSSQVDVNIGNHFGLPSLPFAMSRYGRGGSAHSMVGPTFMHEECIFVSFMMRLF